jgi:hypothetical protein
MWDTVLDSASNPAAFDPQTLIGLRPSLMPERDPCTGVECERIRIDQFAKWVAAT